MLLYTNGCSHTVGDDRALGEDIHLKNYPHHLFRLMTADKPGSHNLINKGITGNNNQLMMSNIVRDLQNIQPDYAVIQFTHANRFWTPGHSHQPNGIHVPPTFVKTQTFREGSDGDAVNKDFYMLHFMSEYAFLECTFQMISWMKYIETLLKSKDIPYTFIVWPHIFDVCYDEFESTIDHSRILNYDNGQYYGMCELMPTYGYTYPYGNHHFEEPAQKYIAKAIYEHATNGTKLVKKSKIERALDTDKFIDSLY
jgi:hypothetical protein